MFNIDILMFFIYNKNGSSDKMDNKKIILDTFSDVWLTQTHNPSFNNTWRLNNNGFDLTFLECGYEKCNPLDYWGFGCKRRYVIHYIISGKGTLISKQTSYPLKSGDVFLIYPDESVRYESDSIDPLEYSWVGFSGIKVPYILKKTCFSKNNPVCNISDEDGLILTSLNNIIKSSKNPDNLDLEVTGNLYLFFNLLIELFPSNKTSNAEEIEKYVQYIETNYPKKLQINDIAKQFGISRSYLFKIFKKNTGTSPIEYIKNVRMYHANYLIDNTNYSLSEIAYAVGYTNPLYFSKQYSEYYGVSPIRKHSSEKIE